MTAPTPFESNVTRVMEDIRALLIEKNRSYGNSALAPVRIFSSASPTEALLVRIDDKLSRVSRGSEFPGEDTIRDLIGYLVLLLVARESE